ncbi:hypothetical protein Golob_027161 [Gossypium lobatum]|uniref:Uncharacterized protein n=1 Tax=Gossypium lobatum TaxID=34289 RepID=A0A7J8LXD4_9ROSI|nr:hypothetical protein [Gossypium lobatum]
MQRKHISSVLQKSKHFIKNSVFVGDEKCSERPYCSICRGNQQEQIHDSYFLLESSSN